MLISDRDKLLRRIRQIRRTNAVSDRSLGDKPEPEPDRLQALEERVAHLEKLLEGFQDSVHRETARHADLIAELQSQVDPGAMSAALAEDVRNRGL
jgi:uncharacterized coiled-coil protein SlyX